jgi:porin
MIRSNRVAASLLLWAASGTCLVRAQGSPGLEDRLIKAGITPSFLYDGDAAADLSGGATRGTSWSGSMHIQIAANGEQLAGVTGLTGWLDALWINGGQPSRFAGDAQGVSNIAATPALRLYEAWLQYNTPHDRYSFLAGRYDLNTEFYHLRSAGLFLNSSFAIGPDFGQSGVGGPSVFPNTSLGFRFAYKPITNAVMRLAILDGAPADPQPGSSGPFNPHNGVLLVAEAAYVAHGADNSSPFSSRFRIGRNADLPAYDDKIAVGAWYYTADFNDLGATTPFGTPVRHQGEDGAYLLVDHLLFQSQNEPKRRVTGFVQLGIANQLVDRFGSYIGAGLTVTGLIAGRPDDELGVAMAMARNGSHYIEGQQMAGLPVTAAETAIELSYLSQIASRVAMEPDFQYVVHPNTDPRRSGAVVAQLRFEFRF